MAHIWAHKRFAELTLGELYGILALRQEVFVVEQRCPYHDLDGLDDRASHLYCVAGDGRAPGDERGGGRPDVEVPRVVACARLFAPGERAPEAVIGRVVTAPSERRDGLGRELMLRAMAAIEREHGPNTPIWLGAQKYVERFYIGLGFVRDGDDYIEDDIPHLPMRRPGR